DRLERAERAVERQAALGIVAARRDVSQLGVVATAPELVDGAVVDDAVQPRGFVRGRLEPARQAPVRLEIRLLEHVVDAGPVGDDPGREPAQPPVVALEQLLEALAVVRRGDPDPPGRIGELGHALFYTPQRRKPLGLMTDSRPSGTWSPSSASR